MNSAIRNRLLTILFVFGLGIYALLPSLRYGLMDESKKSNLSDEQVDYFESRSIKQGLRHWGKERAGPQNHRALVSCYRALVNRP